MRKIYLVDTENVGLRWMQLLPTLESEDRMMLFYTTHTAKFSIDEMKYLLPYMDRIVLTKCFNGHVNSLDFQLCASLGYLYHSDTKAEYIVVSDDVGFDNMIRFMQGMGANVCRYSVRMALARKMVAPKEEKEVVTTTESNEKPGTVVPCRPKKNVLSASYIARILGMPESHPEVMYMVAMLQAIHQLDVHRMKTSKAVELNNRLQKRYNDLGHVYYAKLKSAGVLKKL